jgi:hypothetical protein
MPELVLSPKQRDFIVNSNARINYAWGKKKSGKTFATLIKIHQLLDGDPDNPKAPAVPNGSKVLFSGKSQKTLKANLIDDFRKLGNNMASYHYTLSPLHLHHIRKDIDILCVGADTESDWERIQGTPLALWVADEINLHPRSFVDIALMNLVTWLRMSIWTSNPDHLKHHIKTRFMDCPHCKEMIPPQTPACPKCGTKAQIKHWFFRFRDNPTLSPEYIADMERNITGLAYRRFVKGEWCSALGAILEQWDEGIYVIPWFEPEPYWPRWMSIDFGFVPPNHAFVCQWWTRVPDNVWPSQLQSVGRDIRGPAWIMYREIYTCNTTDEVLGPIILKAMGKERWPDGIYADHDKKGIATLNKFMGNRVRECVKGHVLDKVKAIQDGLNRRDMYFMENCTYHTMNGELRQGRHPAFVEADVPANTVEEMPMWRWSEKDGIILREEPVKEYDHGIDATAYMRMSAITAPGRRVIPVTF